MTKDTSKTGVPRDLHPHEDLWSGRQVGGSHYQKNGAVEPIAFIESWGLSFAIGNAVKYLSRHQRLQPEAAIKSLGKALDYTLRELQATHLARLTFEPCDKVGLRVTGATHVCDGDVFAIWSPEEIDVPPNHIVHAHIAPTPEAIPFDLFVSSNGFDRSEEMAILALVKSRASPFGPDLIAKAVQLLIDIFRNQYGVLPVFDDSGYTGQVVAA